MQVRKKQRRCAVLSQGAMGRAKEGEGTRECAKRREVRQRERDKQGTFERERERRGGV